MIRFGLAAALAVTACKPADTPVSSPRSERSAKPAEPRQDLPDEQRSPDLFGAWLIESVAAPDPALRGQSWDTILLVGVRQLEVLSQCITIGPFDYGRTTGGGIAVGMTSVTPRSGSPSGPGPVQCARGHTPAETALPRVLLAARDVEARDGTVTLSGPAGTISLRRPERALGNPRGNSPPPRVPPLLGAWSFVTVGKRALPATERMELLLRPDRLEWRSGCVSETRELRIDRNVLHPGKIDPFPICERGQTEAELALGRLFEGAVATRMEPNGPLTLSGSGVTAELEPLTS